MSLPNLNFSDSKAEAVAGRVYLTGAGPGDPDLLTVQAVRLIRSADCILHDDLVSPEVLALARADAVVMNVGKRCGQKLITQEQIHDLMIEHARAGQSVVRLKSGDPMIFGRAAEEMAALSEAGIGYEVAPGITAGFAAAALAGVSLTERRFTSRVVLTTRHLAAKTDVGTAENPRAVHPAVSEGWFGPEDAESTLIFYMPGKDYARLERELLAVGWDSSAKVTLVSAASKPGQQMVQLPLGRLRETEPLPAPVVILIQATPAKAE
jgi:uroporphyrin-III C-methyltransferase